MEVKTTKEYPMAFTPPPILCQHCKNWDIADKQHCPVRGCDWGFIYYEVDLAEVSDKLVEDIVVNKPTGGCND